MNGQQRRIRILEILGSSETPVSGASLAAQLNVSRQVIVQDIALLRANGNDILSASRGYLLSTAKEAERVFKVIHTDEQSREEMQLIVDLGGRIRDVFVYHKVYGVLRADMNISSRLDVSNYLAEIASGKSSFLKNVTSGYHYHTVSAASTQLLDIIQQELKKRGFLAPLQDYEPVHFGDDKAPV